MTPLRLQVPPPRLSNAFASACATPPVASIFFSFASAKKPIQRLSGDQKGFHAPSLPAAARAEPSSSARTHSCLRPAASIVVKANR